MPTRTLSEQSGGVLQHEDSLIFKSLETAASRTRRKRERIMFLRLFDEEETEVKLKRYGPTYPKNLSLIMVSRTVEKIAIEKQKR